MLKERSTTVITVGELKERLAPIFTEEGMRLAILFGSHASGKVHRQSDIDLAFLYDRPVDIVALTNRVIRLLHLNNIDVVDLRRASPLMKFSVIKNGTPLYEKEEGMLTDFYSLAFRMYVDAKKLRDAQKETIGYFLEARGLA